MWRGASSHGRRIADLQRDKGRGEHRERIMSLRGNVFARMGREVDVFSDPVC